MPVTLRDFDDDDDGDAFDARGVLKDGRSVRFKDSLDPLQRSVATYFKSANFADSTGTRVTDANGNDGIALCRPGFRRLADASARDAVVEQAHTEYRHWLVNAWRDAGQNQNPPTGAGSVEFRGAVVGQACTVKGSRFKNDFGSPGVIKRMPDGSLDCVPLNPRSEDAAHDHASVMRECYSEYDRAIQVAYKKVNER
jgi:hypothetical protein